MNNKVLAIFAIISTLVLFGALGSSTMSAYATHNDEGHQDKPSVGDCKRFTGDKEGCNNPDSKENFREVRKY